MSARTIAESGGFAFPYAFQHEENMGTLSSGFSPGMTLRDYFAAAALQGLLASFGPDTPHPVRNDQTQNVASEAYAMADAMLKARDKEATP